MVNLDGNSITHHPIAAWPQLGVSCSISGRKERGDGELNCVTTERSVSITRAVERKVAQTTAQGGGPPNRVVGFLRLASLQGYFRSERYNVLLNSHGDPFHMLIYRIGRRGISLGTEPKGEGIEA